MSRICVKGLPKYVAEDRLRDFFSQKGEITDAKLMRTKDGKSRQFAFIGFRTDQEAQQAIKYFNRSYLDTCRITCEVARKVGDQDIPRPWSKYSRAKNVEESNDGNEATGDRSFGNDGAKNEKKEKKKNERGNDVDDPKLQEFLEIMQPRSKMKLWANDSLVAPVNGQNAGIGLKEAQTKKESKEKSVAEEYELDKSDDDVPESTNGVAHDDPISDMDYFKSRVKKDWSDSEGDSSENDDDNNNNNDGDVDEDEDDVDEGTDSPRESFKKNNFQRSQEVTQRSAGEESGTQNSDDEVDPHATSKDEGREILEMSRLFVRNLPYTTTEDELEEHFSRFGDVSEVHIVIDKETKISKGIAYVKYTLPDSAARGLKELDNSSFQGRLLHVMLAKQKNTSDKQEMNAPPNQNSKTLQQRRLEEKKASETGGDTRAWNSLFMRPDTVIEYLARKNGVSKSHFLDLEADDLAARVALAETQVIEETKKALSNAGVNVIALNKKSDNMKRSNHVLLVKNLPYGSSAGELTQMFGKFGSLDKIILPPTKTLALVVFLEPVEARAAFKGLAYKRYKDVPLYLEWAPADILSQSSASKSDENSNTAIGKDDVKRAMLEETIEGISEADIDSDRVESRSLFVKNLNFSTSDDSLRKHFTEHLKEGKILSVKIKKHLKNGKKVSMGFGFIEFDSVDTATKVCKDLQETVLDGHALKLQLCHAKKDEQAARKVEKDKSSTKLIVRNVAFEATEKDLRQIFSPFGQIKSIRLPKKFANHRGFAFIEFVTKQEAQNALESLSTTHLYGRKLVLERAKEGESLEELRARTAARFADEQNGFQNAAKLSKKRKQTVFDEETNKFQRIGD